MPVRQMDLARIDDGLAYGTVQPSALPCVNCGTLCMVMLLDRVEGVEPSAPDNGIIFAKAMRSRTKLLGIGCGCYAKAHRQLAHVKGSRKRPGAGVIPAGGEHPRPQPAQACTCYRRMKNGPHNDTNCPMYRRAAL